MAIVQELNETYFIERFKEMGRGGQFTLDALEALYEYYEELSDSMGEDIKLDVIGICCDWYESTLEDIKNEYDIDLDDCEDEDEELEAIMDYLNDETYALSLDNGNILYQAF